MKKKRRNGPQIPGIADVLVAIRDLNQKVDANHREVNKRFDDVNKRFDDVNHRIDTVISTVNARIDDVQTEIHTISKELGRQEGIREEQARIAKAETAARQWKIGVCISGAIALLAALGLLWQIGRGHQHVSPVPTAPAPVVQEVPPRDTPIVRDILEE